MESNAMIEKGSKGTYLSFFLLDFEIVVNDEMKIYHPGWRLKL